MDGIIIIDKPAGLTSHDVVARARRILNQRRVGHTGTLDPFATGVLVLLVGRATRIARFLSGVEKEYEAWIRFGYKTATGDLTGERLPNNGRAGIVPFRKSMEEIEEALSQFRGEISQVPPMYSAKKIGGKKLYDLARRGEEIARPEVPLIISALGIVRNGEAWFRKNEDQTCDVRVRIACSAGTYVRTLAESIGERLGVPAHVSHLRRIRAGRFGIEDAVTIETLEDLAGSGPREIPVVSSDTALSEMWVLRLNTVDTRRVMNGAPVEVSSEISMEWETGAHVKLRTESGELIAVGAYDDQSKLVRPRVVLV